MSENYIVINGKKAELTEEQLKQLEQLGIKLKNNPFERVEKGEVYSLVDYNGYATSCVDQRWPCDDDSFDCHNYFNDKMFANQVALHQLLYRKLLKFVYDNGYEDVEWNGQRDHWYIYYDFADNKFDTDPDDAFKHQGVYFSSADGANRAIKEVIEPFIKEHPDFVW